jgi:hypothetical protein
VLHASDTSTIPKLRQPCRNVDKGQNEFFCGFFDKKGKKFISGFTFALIFPP